MTEDSYALLRECMVDRQIKARGVVDSRVLAAMRKVPRHLFIPPHLWDQAYNDYPLPIGEDQTISQPYIVALMTELLEIRETDRVLEIGTGSGYQAAVLAQLVKQVYTIEMEPELANSARARLGRLGYSNVSVRQGDGYIGWPEEAPFDRIILTAAPPKIPGALVDQLARGGRLVAPIGPEHNQELMVVEKRADGTVRSWRHEAVSVVIMKAAH